VENHLIFGLVQAVTRVRDVSPHVRILHLRADVQEFIVEPQLAKQQSGSVCLSVSVLATLAFVRYRGVTSVVMSPKSAVHGTSVHVGSSSLLHTRSGCLAPVFDFALQLLPVKDRR
jgi:hypothetical protein